MHEVDEITNGMVAIGPYTYLHGEGKEFHLTEQSALDRAEEVRIKKLQSLDKQIKKISNITFSCKP